jgi:hypothetical protein
MKNKIVIQKFFFFFLLIGLFSQSLKAQENHACETEIFPKEQPNQPLTLCQKHQNEPQPKPIVLGVPGLEFDWEVEMLTGTSGLTDRYVYIVGDFTVTSQFVFNNCIVQIDPGVEIIVGNGMDDYAILSVWNSELFACKGLWEGIQLLDNAEIDTDKSIIEDAKIGINADNVENTISITQTTFNRDRIGIQLGRTVLVYPHSHETNLTILNFSGNQFTCTSPLNGTTNEITFAGVLIQRLGSMNTLGALSGAENLFKKITYGIYAGQYGVGVPLNHLFLDVKNCKFDAVLRIGIFIDPDVVMNVVGCTFINNGTHCVNVLHSDQLKVKFCQITYNDEVIENGKNFYYGIRFNPNGWNTTFNDQDISNNVFDVTFVTSAKYEAIHCISMYGADDGAVGEHYIDINDFHMNFYQRPSMTAQTRAITVTGGIHPNTENSILDNDIEYNNVFSQAAQCFAINVSNGNYSNLSVSDNKFHHPYVQVNLRGEQGIHLAGSAGSNNNVTNNVFDDSESALARSYNFGIWAADFDNTIYNFNHIRECQNDIYYNGMNENTQMICNTMEGGMELLKLDASIIGDQGAINSNGTITVTNGNKWVNTQFETTAIDAICTVPIFANLSKFFVNGSQSQTSIFFPDQINPPVLWFQGSGPEPLCSFQANQYSLEKKILSGEFSDIVNNKCDDWEAKRYLFNRLSIDTEMLNSNESFQQFIINSENSTFATLSKVQNLIDDAYVPNQDLLDKFKQIRDELNPLFEYANNIDEQLYSSENGNESLITQRKVLQAKFIAKRDEIEVLEVENQGSIIDKLIQAKIFNQEIIVNDLWEINTQTINRLTIEFALNQSLDESQWEEVRKIASYCPRDGGMAVYKARGILPDCEIIPEIHESTCSPSSPRSAESAININTFKINPNPNLGLFSIDCGENTVLSIELFDALGKTILQKSFSENMGLISINEDLVSGIYLCKIVTLSGKRLTLPIVVTK